MANFLTPSAYSSQYLGEMQGSLQAQAGVYPEMAANMLRLTPIMQQAQQAGMTGQGQSLMGTYNALYDQSNALQSRYATDQMNLFGNLGAQATKNAYNSMDAGTRGLYDTMQSQAASDLALGSSLNEQDTQIAQQSARAAAEARGLNFGNQGVGMEVLNNYNLGQQRLQQRRQFAGQAYGMGQGLQQMGVQTYLQPAMQTSQQFGLGGIYQGAQGGYEGLGQSFLTPESQYLANIRGGAVQMYNANTAAAAQQKAGMYQGIGALVGGAMAMMCWVAREVYGTETNEWIIFRQWVITEAPEWFRDLYIENGEQFAKFISDKPILKSIVKSAMNIIVKPRLNLSKLYA